MRFEVRWNQVVAGCLKERNLKIKQKKKKNKKKNKKQKKNKKKKKTAIYTKNKKKTSWSRNMRRRRHIVFLFDFVSPITFEYRCQFRSFLQDN